MPPIQKYKISHPYLDISCGLGEAPFYEKSHHSLRFVDIVKKKLHTINLDEGVASHREFDLEFSIGTTADVEGVEGKFVFGGEVFSMLFWGVDGGGRGADCSLVVVRVAERLITGDDDADYADCNRKERIWSF